MLRWLPLLLALAATPLTAQDRAGRNTPGEWVVTHHQPFGLWDSFCDMRQTDGVTEERCYLRYVDVFSPKPKFAAMFLFVTPVDGVSEVEFGIERGTRFDEGGFRIERDGTPIWVNESFACLRLRACTYKRDDAQALLGHMASGEALRFTFTDRHGTDRDLTWSLTRFAEALDDYRGEAAARGLLQAGGL